ncbi:MAG: hypothetical protein JWQ14_916, partial [Adhaeribacter sp.]|nr:hypothetical protein [Adhaeribacter sp.]
LCLVASEPFSAIDLRVTRIFASAFFDEVRKFPTVCQHNLGCRKFFFMRYLARASSPVPSFGPPLAFLNHWDIF